MNASADLPQPITAFVPDETDQDWQSVRDRAVTGLRSGPWTDHNISDPGITMLEAGALSIAEAHMRTELVDFVHAPVASAMWRESTTPSGIELPDNTEAVVRLAERLRANGPVIVDRIRRAAGRAEAIAALAGDPGLDLSAEQADAAVQLHREPVVALASYDKAGAIDAAVDAVGQEDAVELLRLDPAFDELWDAELADLLELRHRRRFRASIDEMAARLREANTMAEVADILAPEVTTPRELLAASGLMARPDMAPEVFEEPDGSTMIWPPTQVQARAVEPVNGSDYVTLALGVDGVRRAWITKGRLVGLGWNGVPVTTPSNDPGALTILVEPEEDAGPDLELRTLRALAGPGELAEVDDPYSLYGDQPDLLVPRRMICDEIGVALVDRCDVEVRAALHVAVGTVTDRSPVITAALARVEQYLRLGRPENRIDANSQTAEPSIEQVDGPWPPPPPAPSGWRPGEPIRLNEIIQLLGNDPSILGVSEVGLRVSGQPWFLPGPGERAEFALEDDCLPRLSDDHCLTVAFVLEEGT